MFAVITTLERTPGKRLRVADLSIEAKNLGATALRVTLKGQGPLAFRSSNAAVGDLYQRPFTALQIIVPSGSTLGSSNGNAFRFWIVIFDDDGKLKIGLINCVSAAAGAGAGRDVTQIYGLSQFGIASSTQISGASNSAGVFYTDGPAVTNKPYIVVGYLTYEAGLVAAGTYASDPSRVQSYLPGTPLAGQTIQVQRTDSGVSATGTTTVPADNTIPQSGEGDQYMTQAITPSSAANVIDVEGILHLTNAATGNNQVQTSLYQDATANALTTAGSAANIANIAGAARVFKRLLANLAVATTFKLRGGSNAAGTTTFNGSGGAQLYGGVFNSFIEAREIMG